MHSNEQPPFVVVELEQGTKAWHAWRRSGIGASEAPTIMGENPFETCEELLEKKQGAIREEGVKSTQMLNGIALEEERDDTTSQLQEMRFDPLASRALATIGCVRALMDSTQVGAA